MSIRIDTPLAMPQSTAAVQDRTILFTFPAAQRIDVVDAVGFDGGFTPHGGSEHVVVLDGTPQKAIKAVRTSWGTRFLFSQPPHAKTFSIAFPQTAPVRDVRSGVARTYRFSLGCLIPACVGRQPLAGSQGNLREGSTLPRHGTNTGTIFAPRTARQTGLPSERGVDGSVEHAPAGRSLQLPVRQMLCRPPGRLLAEGDELRQGIIDDETARVRQQLRDIGPAFSCRKHHNSAVFIGTFNMTSAA